MILHQLMKRGADEGLKGDTTSWQAYSSMSCSHDWHVFTICHTLGQWCIKRQTGDRCLHLFLLYFYRCLCIKMDACDGGCICLCVSVYVSVYYSAGEVELVVDEHLVCTSSTPLLMSSGMALSLLTSLLKGIRWWDFHGGSGEKRRLRAPSYYWNHFMCGWDAVGWDTLSVEKSNKS